MTGKNSRNPVTQGFSTSALLTVWAGQFFVVRGYVTFPRLLLKITTNLVRLKTTEMYSLSSEARESEINFTKPQSKCWPGHLLSGGPRVGNHSSLFLASGGSQHPLAYGLISPVFKSLRQTSLSASL